MKRRKVPTRTGTEADGEHGVDRKACEMQRRETLPVRDPAALPCAKDAPFIEPNFEALLERTRGIGKQGDGLAWQIALRGEWSGR